MKNFSRRRFLAVSAASLAATRLHAQGGMQPHAELSFPSKATGPQMPEDFVGLSYEVQQLTDPTFFSTKNTGLIEQFRALSPHGVLRLGGNTSEFGWFKASPNSPEPKHPETHVVVGEPKPLYYPVTADAIRNLDGFLQATGWRCIYGIGLGTNVPERAAVEARFVASTLGERLEYFQIGNEVDLFGRHLRNPATWNAKSYLEQWLTFARAVAAAVPGAKFGMPDVAGRLDWLTEIADMWGSIHHRPDVIRLTHHYYFGGPATNPEVNIPNLLSQATMVKVQKMADVATAAAKKMGVPVRMTEGNTCYRGGKPGVSDVFAAALWAADYSLLLASNGYTGVNLHGGSGPSVANSVGGSLPGDELLRAKGEMPEQIAKHPHPFYTPIASFGNQYVMEPVAYGQKFAGMLVGGTFLEANLTEKLQATGVDATGYAVMLPGGRLRTILLNKDAQRDLDVEIDFGRHRQRQIETVALHAPALDSREASITPSGQNEAVSDGRYKLTLPHASGVCLTLS